MQKITSSQYKILEALGQYMFLTIKLIDTLKIFKNKISIYRALRPLKEGKKPLIYAQNFSVHPTKGQLSSLLYLSKYGKDVLLENRYNESSIKMPNSKIFVSTDYFHRVANISTHIYLDLYLKVNNGSIFFLDYYFSKSKENRAKNKIDLEDNKYIIPDIVTKFSIDKREYLYIIEIHNGKDTNKAFIQCLQHIKAIDLESPKIKYKHSKNNRVVFIFEFESCMMALIKRMNETNGLKKYLNLFLFKTIDEVEEDFENGWLNFEGENIKFK